MKKGKFTKRKTGKFKSSIKYMAIFVIIFASLFFNTSIPMPVEAAPITHGFEVELSCGHPYTVSPSEIFENSQYAAFGVSCSCGYSDLFVDFYSPRERCSNSSCGQFSRFPAMVDICVYCGNSTHIHTLTWQNDPNWHWKSCQTSGCSYETTKETHVPVGGSTPVWNYTTTQHWLTCASCSMQLSLGNHTLTWKTDANQHWQTCYCGYTTTKVNHTLTWQKDANQHWQSCATCSYTTTKVNHTASSSWTTTSTQHYKLCTSGCGQQMLLANHDILGWWADSNQHWKPCDDCDYKNSLGTHTYGTGGNCTTCTMPHGLYSTPSSHGSSSSWTKDSSYHWKACTISGCDYKYSRATHAYGTGTTCTSGCGQTHSHNYGTGTSCTVTGCSNTHAHNYGTGTTCTVTGCSSTHSHVANTSAWQKDASQHWRSCTTSGCSAKVSAANHTLTWQKDANQHWQSCATCSYTTTKVNHTASSSWTTTSTQHYKLCTQSGCGQQLLLANHTLTWQKDANQHWQSCATCSYTTTKVNHTASSSWTTTSTQHYKLCTQSGCGQQMSLANHTLTWQKDANQHWQSCATCGYTTTKVNHTASSSWTTTSTQHYKLCTSGCGQQMLLANHDILGWWADSNQHWKPCADCDYKTSLGTHTYGTGSNCTNCTMPHGLYSTPSSHGSSSSWTKDSSYHWKACTISGCDYKYSRATHAYGTGTTCTSGCGQTHSHNYGTGTSCTVTGCSNTHSHYSSNPPSWINISATEHRLMCSQQGCSYVLVTASHTWSGNTCTACGRTQ